MWKRLLAIAAIFSLLSIAWLALAGSVSHRTYSSDTSLRDEVSGLWGSAQVQSSPVLIFSWPVKKITRERVRDPETGIERLVTREEDA